MYHYIQVLVAKGSDVSPVLLYLPLWCSTDQFVV